MGTYEEGFRSGAESMRRDVIQTILNEPELPGFPPLGILFQCILKGPIGNARHWIRVAKAVTIKRIKNLPHPQERNDRKLSTNTRSE